MAIIRFKFYFSDQDIGILKFTYFHWENKRICVLLVHMS